jgi:UDP-N-acetylmuramoyl-tripeptide--D-alanyl-D-alanine ligase
MKGFTVQEIATRLGLEGEYPGLVAGYRIDSRQVEPGDLFFALKGEATDGHFFLPDVWERGAVAAVVRKGTKCVGLTLLEVEDVSLALSDLARQSYLHKPTPILAITGSVGKTTTKEFAAVLLEGAMKVGKSPKSYNSQATFPMNLLNRSGEEEVLVLEFGMSEQGQLAKLIDLAPPRIALITKIALAHAMNFPGGLEEIAAEKAEIALHPSTKTCVLDHDLLNYPRAIEKIRAEKVTFSIQDSTADYYLSISDGKFRVDERGVRAWECYLPFKESHVLHNLIAAIAAVRQLGMKWETIEERLAYLTLPKMRFEQFEVEGVWFVNDAYNANPASMRAALENLPEAKEGGKRIGVLGAMKELGEFSEEAHREIGHLAQKRLDWLLCLGEELAPLAEVFARAKKPTEEFSNHEAIAARLKELMRPGDVVLIKGSRSMKLELVLELLHAALPC